MTCCDKLRHRTVTSCDTSYDALGSGVRRVNHYLPLYAPGAGKPVFEDGEMFTVIVPIATGARKATPDVAPEVTPEVTPEVRKMLTVLKGDMGRREIQAKLGLTDEKTAKGRGFLAQRRGATP